MDVMCNLSLSDHKIKDKLIPLSNVEVIENIYVIRNIKGPIINKVKYIEVGKNNNPILNYIKRTYILIKEVIKKKPDIIIGYLFFPHGLLALIVGKIFRKKVIISLIAGPIELVTIRPNKRNDIDYNKDNYELNRLLISIINKYDKIIVTGNYTKKILINNGINEKSVNIIPNVIDENIFNYNRNNIKDIDILILSALTKQKNIMTLCDSLFEYIKNHKNKLAYIIGDGPYKEEIIIKINKNCLNKNIILLDHTNKPEKYFKRAKVFLFASLREGMPATVIEAMNCGCIPILHPCGDIMDLTKDNINSLLYNNIDYYSIVNTLKKLDKINQDNIRNNAIMSSKKLNYNKSMKYWNILLKSMSE